MKTMKTLQALNLLSSFSIYGLQIIGLSPDVIVRKGLAIIFNYFNLTLSFYSWSRGVVT